MSSGDCPDLSVIVVTHNGRDKALAALRTAQERAGDISTEWLVVDCGSVDGTPEAIHARWPHIQLFRRPNIGFAAGNNVALRRARGRYLLLMNPDVELVEGELADLVAALDTRPETGAASVIQCSPDRSPLPSVGRFPSAGRQLGEALRLWRLPGLGHLQERETRSELYLEEHSVDWVVGAFLAVRAEAAAQAGDLDERFFLYSEEKDWCYRIRDAGWDVRHLPHIAVVHHTGGYERPGLKAQLSHSKLLFAHKHYGPARRTGIRAALALQHGLRALALAGRHVAPRWRSGRLRSELEALALVLGRAHPPFRHKTRPYHPVVKVTPPDERHA